MPAPRGHGEDALRRHVASGHGLMVGSPRVSLSPDLVHDLAPDYLYLGAIQVRLPCETTPTLKTPPLLADPGTPGTVPGMRTCRITPHSIFEIRCACLLACCTRERDAGRLEPCRRSAASLLNFVFASGHRARMCRVLECVATSPSTKACLWREAPAPGYEQRPPARPPARRRWCCRRRRAHRLRAPRPCCTPSRMACPSGSSFTAACCSAPSPPLPHSPPKWEQLYSGMLQCALLRALAPRRRRLAAPCRRPVPVCLARAQPHGRPMAESCLD